MAGNEFEVPVNINDVDAVKYSINYNYIDGTNKVLVIISADSELEEVPGWTLLENKKNIAKVLTIGEEEEVIIYDTKGNSSNVYIKFPKEEREDDLLEDNTSKKDNTQSPNVIPQTGKYTIFTSTLIIILTTLTIITLRRYVKENAEDDNL